jgi:hypothetical protein
MPINMVNGRAADALVRIERALARIEIVAASPPRAADNSRSHAELEQRHTMLRQELEMTLGDIDRLIAQSAAAAS